MAPGDMVRVVGRQDVHSRVQVRQSRPETGQLLLDLGNLAGYLVGMCTLGCGTVFSITP